MSGKKWRMVEIAIECEAHVDYGYNDDWGCSRAICETDAPEDVRKWAEKEIQQTFSLSTTEVDSMWHTVMRTVTLEVRVNYHEEHGKVIVDDTECQTVDIPNYVKAWSELEAGQRVREGKV